MNFAVKLRLIALLPVVLAVVIGIILFSASHTLNVVSERERAAVAVVKEIFVLNSLTHSYLQHHGPHFREQWQSRSAQLSRQLAALSFPAPADERRLAEARATQQRLGADFQALTAVADSLVAGGGQDPLLREQEQRRAGQLLTESHTLMSLALQLAAACDAQRQVTRHRAGIAVIVLVTLMAVALAAVSLVISRSITEPIARLRAGTEIVGRGYLDHRIGSDAADEIGQLSRAFDRMTEQLKVVTVSRDELAREVADRKRAEEQLQTFFTVSLEMLCLANFQGHFTRVNAGWTKTLGWTEAELLGQPFLDFVHPDDQEATQQASERLTKGEEVVGFENRYRCRDGSYRWLAWNAVSIPDHQLIVAAARDVTERRRADEQLKATAAALARSNEELQQFAYAASHDLREPLRMITGFIQLLERRYRNQLDAEAGQYIGYAVDGAQRMQRLIDGLLEYARIETRAKPSAPVDCGRVAQVVLANLQVAIAESGGNVTLHGRLPTVAGDEVQLTQLFQNLVSNALKFRRPGVLPRIEISASGGRPEWTFRVRDNGIGIASENLPRLFVIFQRLHSATEYPGTGIGLALCKKIVERHGGRIWVESTPGRGTTFLFTLPAA